MVAEATLSVPGAMGKLDSKSFSHKVRSVLEGGVLARGRRGRRGLE